MNETRLSPQKEEYAVLQIKVPKKIIDFFEAWLALNKSHWTVQQILENSVMQIAEDLATNHAIFHAPFSNGEDKALERWGLKELFDC